MIGKFSIFIVSIVAIVLFQNYTVYLPQNNDFVLILKPSELLISADARFYTDKSNSNPALIRNSYEIKNEGVPQHTPRIMDFDRRTKVLQFSTRLSPGMKKARSELRVIGGDVHFSDSINDQFYFTSFDIFIPQVTGPEFNRDRIHRGDWNIIWQCAQIGADTPHYVNATSPPLSLQLYGQQIFVRTINDYYPWSGDRSNSSVFNRWERLRTLNNPSASEIGDGEPLRRDFIYGGYLRRGQWNRVFMKFKLGLHGSYRIWVNDVLSGQKIGSIGYRTADDPFSSQPVYSDSDGRHIRKKCSARFGVYQGYGDENATDNIATESQVLIRRFAIGTDWNAVKFDSQILQ